MFLYRANLFEIGSICLIRKVCDLGCTLFDTAEACAPYVNEELVGKAGKPFRDKIILTTKFPQFFLQGRSVQRGS